MDKNKEEKPDIMKTLAKVYNNFLKGVPTSYEEKPANSKKDNKKKDRIASNLQNNK